MIPILLVDDQASNLAALEGMLASSGCRLVQALSADEALLKLLREDFAAIVLDVKMPGMSGFELAKLIKTRKRTQHVPILFLTAYLLDDGDVRRGYEAGAVDYLTKPIDPIVLQSKIAVFAELFRKRGELAEANESLERRVRERTEALHEADQRKNEFLAVLAHELRNPLAPVSYALELFNLKGTPTPELQWAHDVIVRQVRQMTRLVDDLLDVSRISRGALELHRERVTLDALFQNAVETSRPLIEQRGVRVSVAVPPEPVVVDVDPVRMAQGFTNLLNNGAKYTEPGGNIWISATPRDGGIMVSIKDSGMGIPADQLDRIFEIFAQVDRSLERGHAGLGVGLALVKKIVELHGGRVEARSDGLGRGSEFLIWLPVMENPAEELSPPTREVRTSIRRRIVVAEDGRDAADGFGMLLSLMGHDVRVAYNGEEALIHVSEFRPEVVIMDIGMPKLNGFEAARRIRAESWGRDMFLIALTGWGQVEDRHQSHAAGFDRHFTKPVDLDLLETLLASLEQERLIPVSSVRSEKPEPEFGN